MEYWKVNRGSIPLFHYSTIPELVSRHILVVFNNPLK
jgi:hypothetical protein